MSKQNNLTDFLTGVANAIRTKKGTTALINPQNFESEIASISTGSQLNIAYSDSVPEDTSKLWIKTTEPENIEFAKNLEQQLQGPYVYKELQTAAYNIAAAAVGTKIYLFGGDSSSRYLNTIQEFDTETKAITTLSATLPTAAHSIAAAAVGTKIYLFGGRGNDILNTIQEFDTETKAITTLSATLPTAASCIGAAAVGTKIYLFGGYKGGSGTNDLNTIQEFDTETKAITTLSTTLPTTNENMGTAAVGTKIYLFGGGSSGRNTIQEFDTETKAITTLSATLPKGAYGMGAAAVGTKIYLFGGYGNSSGFLNTIQEFDTETKAITTLSATLPKGARYMGTAAVGTKIYLFGGGSSGGSYLNTIQGYIFAALLTENDIFVQEDFDENIFALISLPTKIEIGVKNVYKGNSSNVAEFVDAYLYNGTNWVNINTGELYTAL